MYYVVVSLGSSFYFGVVGVFTSYGEALAGIRAYEEALKERNPHFRMSSLLVEKLNPPDIGNHDAIDYTTNQWAVRGGHHTYVIAEHALNNRLKPVAT